MSKGVIKCIIIFQDLIFYILGIKKGETYMNLFSLVNEETITLKNILTEYIQNCINITILDMSCSEPCETNMRKYDFTKYGGKRRRRKNKTKKCKIL